MDNHLELSRGSVNTKNRYRDNHNNAHNFVNHFQPLLEHHATKDARKHNDPATVDIFAGRGIFEGDS